MARITLKNLLWVITATLLSASSIAGEGSLDYFSCPSTKSGKSCSESCKQIGEVSFDVRGKAKDGNVHVTLFTENEKAPETLKNCNIHSPDEWVCEKVEIFHEELHTMSEGIYFSKKIFRMLDGEDDVSIYCARE